jgi:hypothetical protein
MNDYKPTSRPAAFGAAAIALTAITIALAVVLPAKLDSDSRGVRTVAAPLSVSAAAEPDPGPIRVDVIASRNPPAAPMHTHLRVPKSKQRADRMGTHAVAAPEPLSRADARLQPALCPYLIRGTDAAIS